jgi:Flp pilus assembly protein TadG
MKSKSQSGAQILEFALLLPFLLLIIFLIIDFGFLVYNKAVITNASREAARKGTVLTATPWSKAAVEIVACDYARNLLISTRSGTHTSTCSGTADPDIEVVNPNGNVPPNFGDPITVEIRYVYSGFLTSTSTFLLRVPPWELIASTKMNHE